MKLTVALEVDDRSVVHQLDTKEAETRQDLRNVMTDISIRMELAVYGPPLDPDLSKTDRVYQFKDHDG